MHLKELVLEGFKSYAQKTVIQPFDKHFNAITGLNGSGKSNILDSLIFLLGITGYKDLRASDTRDLIYKQGSAGITQATVTGVFDNSDPARSPNGYSNCKSITVSRTILPTGQSKYSINNTRCTQAQVQEMFQSVQLNVLNPHFIVMQGRIAKVCNMKPHELLKLIEEATGTTMYENKRDAALRNIEKRESALQQSYELLTTLRNRRDELQSEVQKYNEFRQLEPQIKQLKRQLTAIQYLELVAKIDGLEGDQIRLADELARIQAEIDKASTEQQQFGEQRRQLEAQVNAGENRQQTEQQVKLYEKELAEIGAQVDNYKKTRITLERKQAKLVQDIASIAQQLQQSQVQLIDADRIALDSFQLEEDCRRDIETISDTIHGAATGGASSGGLTERKLREEESVALAETAIHGAQTQIKSYMNTIEEQRSTQGREQYAYQKLESDIAALQAGLDSTQESLLQDVRQTCTKVAKALSGQSVLDISPQEYAQHQDLSLPNGLQVLRQQAPQLRNRMDHLTQQSQQAQQRATNPLNKPEWFATQRNLGLFNAINKSGPFDPKLLYGLLVNLFTVRDVNTFGLAIEVTAGGKLFNICCENYQIGSHILKANQNAQMPITILALDRVSPNINRNKIESIQRRYPDNVYLASDLIELRPNTPSSFDRVVQFVFGSTFICQDMVTAKEISREGCRAVTVQGDVYDPSGIISGGSTQGMDWLREYLRGQTYSDEARRIGQLANDYEAVNRKCHEVLGAAEKINNFKIEIASKTERLHRSPYQRTLELIEKAEKEIERCNLEIVDQKKNIERAKQQIQHFAQLAADMSGSHGERKKKELQQELQQKKKQLLIFQKTARDTKSKVEDIQHDIRTHTENLEENKRNNTEAQENYEQIQKQYDESILEQATARTKLEDARHADKELSERNQEFYRQLQTILEEIDSHRNQTEQKRKRHVEMAQDKNRKAEELKKVQQEVLHVNKEHPWIRQEQSNFNVHGSQFDFSNLTSENIQEKLDKAKEKLTTLKKYNNPLSIDQFQQLQTDYVDKETKLKNIQEERDAIEKSIRRLDQKKIETVENTFTVVNTYFSSIFSILLPGASSRLKPHRTNGTLMGCEMEVGFSGRWKDSLSELSGGQRSLLALSLILALLRCKPAPLYILDEVDAALDASHTQNIGKTIKEHFQQSQFIIVSLKEGMFENANVLIRTQLGPNGSALSVNRRNQ